MTVHNTRGTARACLGLVVLLLPRLCAAYLGIEPLRTELTARPGETVEGQITLTNEKDVPVDIEVSFRDRSASRATHADWIEIDTREQHLDPRAAAVVRYRISVPESAAGEFFGRVGFSEVSESSPGTVSIQTRISVPLFVTIEGTEEYRANVEGVRLQSASPLKLQVAVANHGNVHLRASGLCSLVDAESGEEVMRFPVNPQRFPLYPGVTNKLVAISRQGLPPGDYICSVEMPFPDEQHMISGSFDLHVSGGGK